MTAHEALRALRKWLKIPEGQPAPAWSFKVLFKFDPNRTAGTYDPQLDVYELEGIRFTGQWLRDHREELTPK